MVLKQIAEEVGSSLDGVTYTTGRMRIQRQLIAAVAATATGDANTAMTSSTTTYNILARMPKGATLISCIIRTEAAGVAGGTIDLLKAASGTAISSGTAMVTQINGNAPTAATDYKMAVKTDGSQVVAAGSLIVLKVVTGGTETLKPLYVDLEFQL